MRILKLFFIIIIMLLGAVFAVLNAEPAHFDYYFGSREVPLSLIAVTAFGIGVLSGLLSAIGLILGLKQKNLSLKRRCRLVDEELKHLRNMPHKEESNSAV